MSFTIDESSLFTSHHIYKAVLVFAVVRWIISWILKFVDSDTAAVSASSHSNSGEKISAQVIRDSLELTTYGDITAQSACDEEPCAVCLNRLEEEDAVRRLRCRHVFHAECIDKWIEYDHEHVTCPLCRAALVGSNGFSFRPIKSEPSWAVERMLYIFGDDDDNLHM
uniref:RING-type domain-containing protein n=1 Tax=Kalanchoe fedtschenkoi TaxID=63787 RepID=A0A7N0VAE1_KALFE